MARVEAWQPENQSSYLGGDASRPSYSPMRIRASNRSFPEVAVRATARELLALAHVITEGSGRVDADGIGDATPYEILLGRLIVDCDLEGAVRVEVDWASKTLTFRGSAEAATLLAANIEAITEASPGTHHHLEYVPLDGVPNYLDEHAVPLVVELV